MAFIRLTYGIHIHMTFKYRRIWMPISKHKSSIDNSMRKCGIFFRRLIMSIVHSIYVILYYLSYEYSYKDDILFSRYFWNKILFRCVNKCKWLMRFVRNHKKKYFKMWLYNEVYKLIFSEVYNLIFKWKTKKANSKCL